MRPSNWQAIFRVRVKNNYAAMTEEQQMFSAFILSQSDRCLQEIHNFKVLEEYNTYFSAKFCSRCKEAGDCCVIDHEDDPLQHCFFWQNNRCSIYNIRPLFCRSWHCGKESEVRIQKFFRQRGEQKSPLRCYRDLYDELQKELQEREKDPAFRALQDLMKEIPEEARQKLLKATRQDMLRDLKTEHETKFLR